MKLRHIESTPALPLEVIEQIVDASLDDRRLLRNLALTSKALIPRSQAHLFARLEFDLAYDYPASNVTRDLDVYDRVRATAGRLSGASEFFRTRTHLLSYVQSFMFRHNSVFVAEIVAVFGELFPHLVNLREVHIENWDWSWTLKDNLNTHELMAQLFKSISGRTGSKAVIRGCFFDRPSELAALLHDYDSVDLSTSSFTEDDLETSDLDFKTPECRPRVLCIERIPSPQMRGFLANRNYIDLSALKELECSTMALRHIMHNVPDYSSLFAQIDRLVVPFDPSSDSSRESFSLSSPRYSMPTAISASLRIPLELFTTLQVLDIRLTLPIRHDYRVLGNLGYLDLVRKTVERVKLTGHPAFYLRELHIGKFYILEAGYEQRTVEELESMLPAVSAALLDKESFPALERVQIDVQGDTVRHAVILKGVFEELMPGIKANGILDVNAIYGESGLLRFSSVLITYFIIRGNQ